MENLIFRNARPEDLRQIVDIYNSTVPTRMVTADTQPVSIDDKRKWFDEHSPDKRPLWVIDNPTGEMVGWVSFQSFYGRPAYDATAEISIYLSPDHRGKGMGKKILKHSLQEATKFGIKTLLGFIFAHNEPSIKLFQHFGFSEWGNLSNIAILDGQERSLKILGLRIAA